MFPKPPRPEPPRKAVAMQVVQQRVCGAVDTSRIVLPAAPPAPPAVKDAASSR
ncbi:MAG: hypothetical protein K0R43_937 [Pseudoduganella sp.]|jgi:hypothetical protein|nr:hypothetical protein [Pseudoduganella sp.]